MPNVQWRTPDDGQRNCPKYVEFLDENKFGKIRASVGFIKKKKARMLILHVSIPYCPVLEALPYNLEGRGFDFRWSH